MVTHDVMRPLPVTLRQADALVGLPYIDGEFDCSHLVVRVAQELFGLPVELPAMRRHPLGKVTQAAAIARGLRELTVPVGDQAARAGDLVLFTEALPGRGLRYHLGTLLEHQGERWVLHTRDGAGSVLQRLVVALSMGLRVDGYYRWRVCVPAEQKG